MAAHGCFVGDFGKQLVFCGRKEYLRKMHHETFSQCGIRLRIRDIPEFPECQYIVDPITLDECDRRKIGRALSNARALRMMLWSRTKSRYHCMKSRFCDRQIFYEGKIMTEIRK
jgi:hypothetical protein